MPWKAEVQAPPQSAAREGTGQQRPWPGASLRAMLLLNS